MAEIIIASEFVTDGEKKTAQFFETGLPNNWAVICNKLLVDSKGKSNEVDFIIIGKNAIYLVEEKGYKGKIQATTQYWIFDSGEAFHSPFNQAEINAKRLAGLLRRQVASTKELKEFVHSFVILSYPESEINIQDRDPRIRNRLLYIETACDRLKHFDNNCANESISSCRNFIVNFMKAIPDRTSIPKKLNRFNIIEKIGSSTELCQSYKAKHEDLSDSLYILKVYPIKYKFSEYDKKQQEIVIKREFEVLNKLSETGIVPEVIPPFNVGEGDIIAFPYKLPEGVSLASFLDHHSIIKPEYALQIIYILLRNLAEIHQKQILHRNISPLSVYIKEEEPPSLMFTDFELARISQEETISEYYTDKTFLNPYAAEELELGLGFADYYSDIYSLGIILYQMLTGEVPKDRKIDEDKIRYKLSVFDKKTIDTLVELIMAMTLVDYMQRIQTVREVLEILEPIVIELGIKISSSEVRNETLPKSVDQDTRWEINTLILERYKIIEHLGKSRTAFTYLAKDLKMDEFCVLKRFSSTYCRIDNIQSEVKILRKLEHPGLVKVFDGYPPEDPFHIKYEYIQGQTLEEFMKQSPLSLSRLNEIGSYLIETLCYLEEQNIRHRDISPKNIVFDDNRMIPRLVDFGLATGDPNNQDYPVGTPKYWTPEMERGDKINHTSDYYAVAIIIYQLLTGKMPFGDKFERFDKLNLIDPDNQDGIRTKIWTVLKKALESDIGKRYDSIAEMKIAWKDAFEPEPHISVSKTSIINEWVTQIQKVYRNSRQGNQENRGLDSDFAREGYIPTGLDEELLPKVIQGDYSLVFLSGNPGDGKTAFLEIVEKRLTELKAKRLRKDHNGWHYEKNGHHYYANYDASESYQGKSSDEVLKEMFKDFEGNKPQIDKNKTVLLAINDGRLLGFFLNNLSYPWLGNQIENIINNQSNTDPRIVIINLKLRSLILGESRTTGENKDFFDKTLDFFLKKEKWEKCSFCQSSSHCPIKFNVDSLNDEIFGKQLRKKLKILFQILILRGRQQLTIRDLRSIISYILVNVHDCRHWHNIKENEIDIKEVLNSLYFNSVFNIDKEPDEFLTELSQYDPANYPAPKVERIIYHNRTPERIDDLSDMFVKFNRDNSILKDMTSELMGKNFYRHLKRRYFFESHNKISDKNPITWIKLLPYRYLDTFVKILDYKININDVKKPISMGISRSDGLLEDRVTKNHLCVKTNENTQQELIVFRKYPIEEFLCTLPSLPDFPWMEIYPRHIIFQRNTGSPRLVIGLDLFEILMRFSEGYLPYSEEMLPFLRDLEQFKSHLLREESFDLVLLESGRRLHQIIQENKEIIRKEWV